MRRKIPTYNSDEERAIRDTFIDPNVLESVKDQLLAAALREIGQTRQRANRMETITAVSVKVVRNGMPIFG